MTDQLKMKINAHTTMIAMLYEKTDACDPFSYRLYVDNSNDAYNAVKDGVVATENYIKSENQYSDVKALLKKGLVRVKSADMIDNISMYISLELTLNITPAEFERRTTTIKEAAMLRAYFLSENQLYNLGYDFRFKCAMTKIESLEYLHKRTGDLLNNYKSKKQHNIS